MPTLYIESDHVLARKKNEKDPLPLRGKGNDVFINSRTDIWMNHR